MIVTKISMIPADDSFFRKSRKNCEGILVSLNGEFY